MKFYLNDGCMVEVKVTGEGSKTPSARLTSDFVNQMVLGFIHSANFLSGQGMTVEADEYLEIAKAIMNSK